jgi:hypothetical protein
MFGFDFHICFTDLTVFSGKTNFLDLSWVIFDVTYDTQMQGVDLKSKGLSEFNFLAFW